MDNGKTEQEREEEEITRPAHDLWDTAPIVRNDENNAEDSKQKNESPEYSEDHYEDQPANESPSESTNVPPPPQQQSFYETEQSNAGRTLPQSPVEPFDEESKLSIGKFLRRFLIVLIILFLILGFFFWRGMNKSENTTSPSNETSVSTPSQVTPTSIQPTEVTTNPSITTKRLFNPQANFFDNTTYPSVLSSYSNNDLVGLSCSSQYSCSDSGCNVTAKKPYSPDNATIREWYNEAVITTQTSNISSLQACQTSTGQHILLYHQPGDTNGIGSIDYIGRVESDNTVTRLVAITNLSYPHFICDKPLELTSLNLLFLQCSSSSDVFKSETIYGVNMATSAYTQLINCTSQIDPNTKKTISSCQ